MCRHDPHARAGEHAPLPMPMAPVPLQAADATWGNAAPDWGNADRQLSGLEAEGWMLMTMMNPELYFRRPCGVPGCTLHLGTGAFARREATIREARQADEVAAQEQGYAQLLFKHV